MRDIVILVSSLHELTQQGVPFLITDRHAYLETAQFWNDLTDLSRLDWKILQARDFQRDPHDLGKFERYQAEALRPPTPSGRSADRYRLSWHAGGAAHS